MHYHPKNNKKRSHKKTTLFVVLFILVLFFAGGKIRGFFQIINFSANSVRLITITPLEGLFGYFESKKILIEENKELGLENKSLKIELLTLESLREENKNLKEVLDYERVPDERLLARVINKPPLSPFDTFIIDAGNSDLQIDSDVYYRDVLIGKISETFSKTAIVKLNSSPDIEITIKINDNDTTARGHSNGTFEIMLPKDVLVEVGDIIKQDSSVIAVVSGIESESSNTFQKIYFSYPFKLQEIDWVEVEKVN